MPDATWTEVEPFARMALDAVTREYPNALQHVLTSDADARTPRALHPAFYGAFDWHSAVHGHWCLARTVRTFPEAPLARDARAVLNAHLCAPAIAAEVAYLEEPGRGGFERPYGLAWLLQLAAELRTWDDADARRWSESLAPLERRACERLATWLPALPYPIRVGEHAQTAFALGLAHDWARVAGERAVEALVARRARDFFAADRDGPVAWEPSGHDFLSPLLGEADLLRRVLPRREFAAWLEALLPDAGAPAVARWLTPVTSPDRADGKLAHLDGLNLSRAWMLEGIVSALEHGDPLRSPLADAAGRHRLAGLDGARGTHYAGTHWLGSFAIYLLTRRGCDAA
jgi:Protein of unknown function (DUF2891)